MDNCEYRSQNDYVTRGKLVLLRKFALGTPLAYNQRRIVTCFRFANKKAYTRDARYVAIN